MQRNKSKTIFLNKILSEDFEGIINFFFRFLIIYGRDVFMSFYNLSNLNNFHPLCAAKFVDAKEKDEIFMRDRELNQVLKLTAGVMMIKK
jgi:hypothetical protein